MTDPLLCVRGLRVSYPGGAAAVHAVDGVDLDLARGETLGLVGESGCGKSTLVRTLVGLERADAGSARFGGRELLTLGRRAWRPLRREIQLVFQDPYASLDPRMRVGSIVGEPLAVHERLRGARATRRVAALLERVRLDAALAARYPHELSGGQRQRVGLARALALEPTLLLLDEPVSALDVSVQAQILELLVELRESLGLTMLLIAHHLAVVRRLAQRVAVMFAGRIVEEAPRDLLFSAPLHPYTRLLLEAAPTPDPRRPPVAPGRAVERGVAPGPGCALRNRCPLAVERCAVETPRLAAHGEGRRVACHRAGEGGGPRPGVPLKPPSRDGR